MKKDSISSLIFCREPYLKGGGSRRRAMTPSERPKNMYDIKTTRQKIFAFVKIISYDFRGSRAQNMQVERFQQNAGPKPEMENIVHSDSHLKKRFLVFFEPLCACLASKQEKSANMTSQKFFATIQYLIWVSKKRRILC